jgi:predicted nucleic acid-binding protein
VILCDTGPLVAAAIRNDDDNHACTELFTGLHPAGRHILVPIGCQPADCARMADLVQTYADFPLGTTDAAVLALAERLNITEIATLDRRHFAAVRPSHVTALTLLP